MQPNYIVSIWSYDTFNPYFLIKSLAKPNEIIDKFCDDYRHTFHIGYTVETRSYLKVKKNVTLLYKDSSKVVAVSSVRKKCEYA